MWYYCRRLLAIKNFNYCTYKLQLNKNENIKHNKLNALFHSVGVKHKKSFVLRTIIKLY